MAGRWRVSEDHDAALLARLAERAPAMGLTAEEVVALQRVAERERALAVLGRAGRLIVVTLGLVAAFIAAWDVIVERVRAWLAG